MQLEVDSDLKKAFLACVSRAYNGKVEEGILDLMRIYVERAKGTPGQKMIKEKVKEYVYGGEVQAGLSPREMEKIFLNPATNKQWRIEIDGHTIRTCLNGGKVKEILCDSAYQVKSKAASAMMGQMRKGFVYQNPDAAVGQARCHRFVGKDNNGFMPLATALTRDDFFLTRVVGDFEDETLYHFDGSGEILETVSLGAKRMTYEQVLCPNNTLLLNNSYLLQQFSLRTHEITPFANKKNSMKAMLDASGDLALWYTGEEIVVFDFGSNTEVWRETVKCKKSKDPNFAYYCFGMLSPRHSKAAYRVTEGEYVLVDLKSAQKVVIPNEGWHPFFSPDDQCFSVGGRFYLTQTGEEIANPFPFSVQQGLSFSDTCMIRTRGRLMAVQQDRGSSPIELWDTGSGQLLATIDDPFVVRQVNFAFTKSGLVLHTDYGAMSIYSCAL